MGTILPSRLRSPSEHTGEAKVALFPRLPLLAEGSCLPQQTDGFPLRGIPVFRSAYFPIPHRPTFGAPVFRSAYSASQNARASAAFAASIKPYLCSKTLDLQPLRSPSDAAPNQLFELLRCFGRLFFRKSFQLFLQNARPPGSLRSPFGGRGELRSPLHPPLPPPRILERQTGTPFGLYSAKGASLPSQRLRGCPPSPPPSFVLS